MKVKGKNVILALVCLILGFMVAFSYNLTKKELENNTFTNGEYWKEEYQLREQLIKQEEKNRQLQQELLQKQTDISHVEQSLAKEQKGLASMTEEIEKYRMYLGKIKVNGSGVEIKLTDGDYNPDSENVNNYIVHEHHIFNVINELKTAGAVAIAINGQRIAKNSYIICNGPVITVDGNQYPAPFVITAIGNQDTLTGALNISGGVKDQLVNDNIIFSIEKKDNLQLNSILGG